MYKDIFFDTNEKTNVNLLPYDGTVYYYVRVLTREQSDYFLNALLESIEWKHDEYTLYGKSIITSREVSWYGDFLIHIQVQLKRH